jgi:hypothetical protein
MFRNEPISIRKSNAAHQEFSFIGNEEKASPIHNLCQGSYAGTDLLPNCFQSKLKKSAGGSQRSEGVRKRYLAYGHLKKINRRQLSAGDSTRTNDEACLPAIS